MLCRILIAILVTASTVVAQQQRQPTNRPPQPKAENKESSIADDAPQFVFEIRMVSASETLLRPLRKLGEASVPLAETTEPFEGWQPLNPAQAILLRKSGTHIQQTVEPAVIELSDEQINDFVNAAQGDTRSNILLAPKVTVFEGQVGAIADQTKVAFLIHESGSSEPKTCEATEGTQIYVRATSLDEGRVQVDAKIQLRCLPNKTQIPVGKVLTRAPEQTVSTISVSGVLSGKTLHIAVIPPETAAPPEKPSPRIRLVSRIIRPGKSESFPPSPLVWLVTVRRIVGAQSNPM